MTTVRIAGTGSFVPPTIITNEILAALITRYEPGKGAEWAKEKLGIEERRFMTALDPETGHPLEQSDEIAMAEAAARQAIADAGLLPDEVAGLWYVSCTQSEDRQHFSLLAHELHRRLGLRPEAPLLEMDAGCGGALYAMSLAECLLKGSERDNMLVVASNGPSKFYTNWEAYGQSGAWLSMYIFGDGAGAILLRKARCKDTAGIIGTYSAVDPTQSLMEYRRGTPTGPSVYYIDGRAVATSFGTYARRALDGLRARHPFDVGAVQRFYFHQVNGRVLQKFVAEAGIPQDKVATHVERYGNIAAAATLVLLDEDRRAGIVRSGDLCVFCTVGAGAQYGAMIVRL
jgi:3-oxoacyl-[acyl-carrier-protein] synthase-3